ncbi:uncharacterized protein EV154DRAFT_506543 [Mucor mucedo]|uniref:uncharacterized protein n=1 Tax=Mucor mucedo TaxID=29922 RepID=UPI00221FE32F|nr:uncharacterized protein EV154DRAFT_506543 [Mucor mucedo]KAI7891984.1 hypothetical protein EV154DRAFT_506543 [Mucor mucedo]
MYPTDHERAPGITGMAKEFESIYFDTEDSLELTSYHLKDIEEELRFQERSRFIIKNLSYLEDDEYQWKMIDMFDTSMMMDTLNNDALKADEDLRSLFDSVTSLLESTDNLKLDEIKSCLKDDEVNPDALDSIKQSLQDDVKKQAKELETKATNSKEDLKALEKQIELYKQDLQSIKSNEFDESKITAYALRRTIRDIEKSISVQSNKISCLEQEELALRLKNNTAARISSPLESQRGAFGKQVYLSLQKFGKPLAA